MENKIENHSGSRHESQSSVAVRPDPIDSLTGKHSNRIHPGGIGLPGSGEKFTPDGAVQGWPGNTFICHLDRTSDAYLAITELQERIKMSPYAGFYTFLPPPSFHMTVFQGHSPGNSMPDGITQPLSRDGLTGAMLQRTESLALPTSVQIKVTDLFTAHSLTATGYDTEQEQQLRGMRSELREATGIRPEKFESYVFHISLGYLLQWLTISTAKQIVEFSEKLFEDYRDDLSKIELGPVEFCNFDTMHHFEPLKVFAGKSNQ